MENPKLHVNLDLTVDGRPVKIDFDFTINYSALEVIELQSMIILASEEIQRRVDKRAGRE